MADLLRSLTFRLAVLTALWLAAGLGASAWYMAHQTTRQIEAGFEARLLAVLGAVVAASAVDGDGAVVLVSAPTGGEFDRPLSGDYWQILLEDGSTAARSRSLWDQALASPVRSHAGVDVRRVVGPQGEPLGLAERDLLLPGATHMVHVAVALSRVELEEGLSRLGRSRAVTFAIVCVGLVAIVVLQLVIGLAPLRRARRRLAEVRAGQRDRLALQVPPEVQPLVTEIDALIAQNCATVERARTHVGNLAHALKTPVAVLRNALEATPPDVSTARMEARTLDELVQHHLARARAAALAGATAAEQSPLAIAEDVASALRRIFAERGLLIGVTGAPHVRLRMDPQDLTEMLGNLMENACKWARTTVQVSIARDAETVVLRVEDDGPGISGSQLAEVLPRGRRFDEATPGTGLGLSIVADLAALYAASFDLRQSPLGGLCAVISIPARERDQRV
jgi:signal transduction histidine kinase